MAMNEGTQEDGSDFTIFGYSGVAVFIIFKLPSDNVYVSLITEI